MTRWVCCPCSVPLQQARLPQTGHCNPAATACLFAVSGQHQGRLSPMLLLLGCWVLVQRLRGTLGLHAIRMRAQKGSRQGGIDEVQLAQAFQSFPMVTCPQADVSRALVHLQPRGKAGI